MAKAKKSKSKLTKKARAVVAATLRRMKKREAEAAALIKRATSKLKH